MDAFGCLRISEKFTTFESSTYGLSGSNDADLWVTELYNGGTATRDSTNNFLPLTVTSTSGNYVLRQTKHRMIYQPGKSRLSMYTCVPLVSSSTTLVTSYVGIFSTTTSSNVVTITNGHYLKTNNSSINLVETLNSVDTTVAQSSWNIDKLNGTGISGKTLNINKNILLVIDQQYLGVGRVRMGFSIGGIIYYAHQFTHDDIAVPYTFTARIPISYYIVSSGEAGTLRQFCCTCISEGGLSILGRRLSNGTTAGGITLSTADVKYVLCGFRVNSSHTTTMFHPSYISAICKEGGSTKIIKVQLQLHSTNGTSIGAVSGTFSWTSLYNNSTLDNMIGDGTQTVTTDGYILHTEMVTVGTSTNFNFSTLNPHLSRFLATQYDQAYLIVSCNTTNTVVSVGMDVFEIF